MDATPYAIVVTAVAIGAGLAVRWRLARRRARDRARHVEAERIVSLLSGRQPGVWDQDELRERIQATARDLYGVGAPGAFDALAQWVSPTLLGRTRAAWPAEAVRRESKVAFKGRVAFVHVNEGGPGADRVIARLLMQHEARWLDARGRVRKRERHRLGPTYHTWLHIDGQGWHLETIAAHAPEGEPPPSSVTCRILPEAAPAEKRAP